MVITTAGGLLTPMSVDFRSVVPSMAVFVAMLARLQWMYYRKHL